MRDRSKQDASPEAENAAPERDERVDEGVDEPSGEPPEEDPVEEAERDARELAEVKDRYLRMAAEFDNYRKRTERERSESWIRAQAELASRLLEPLDDLQRVSSQAGDEAGVDAVLEGVRLVERKLLRVLEDAGLERVETDGEPFDPEVHEALMTVPAEDESDDDTVADVFQEGYRFKGVLLRPARVRVRKYEE